MGPDIFLRPGKFWVPFCGCLRVLATARSACVPLGSQKHKDGGESSKQGVCGHCPLGVQHPAVTGRGTLYTVGAFLKDKRRQDCVGIETGLGVDALSLNRISSPFQLHDTEQFRERL